MSVPDKSQDNDLDTILRCHHCDKTEMASIKYMVQNGWKFCHNEAMHLEKTNAAQVQEAVRLLAVRNRNGKVGISISKSRSTLN